LEDVLEIIHKEQKRHLAGVIVHSAAQTPLKWPMACRDAGVPILGTTPTPSTWRGTASVSSLAGRLKLKQPRNGTAMTAEEPSRAASPSLPPDLPPPIPGRIAAMVGVSTSELKKQVESAN